MKKQSQKTSLPRRDFVRLVAAGSAGIFVAPRLLGAPGPEQAQDDKPKTNVEDALKYPRTETSMPGRFPGRVVQVTHDKAMADGSPVQASVDAMVREAMISLTGAASAAAAWKTFLSPADIVGIKVNPVAGMQLSTNTEVVKAITSQLVDAGVPAGNIVIWDRREFQIFEAGFKKEDFPGIKFAGTEIKDEKDSFTGSDGQLYSLGRIDRNWFYWADVEEEYDAETLPFMVNSGKYSYFSKICTQEVDKIINVAVLKNAGASATLCLKNLAYGAITNTGRLHKKLWAETCAEVCAFPPLRDKVVLNFVDGLRGCYNGGPGANPQFIEEYNTLLAGTDPVAVDRVGYELILKRRLELKVQQEENPKGRKFLTLAENLGLGTADLQKINWMKLNLS